MGTDLLGADFRNLPEYYSWQSSRYRCGFPMDIQLYRIIHFPGII